MGPPQGCSVEPEGATEAAESEADLVAILFYRAGARN